MAKSRIEDAPCAIRHWQPNRVPLRSRTMNLTDKTALVTGGTRGIGAATAIALAREGAHVAINGRHDDTEAQTTRQAILALGRRCELLLTDCARPDEATRCVRETVERLGGVDVVVHCAGGAVNGGLFDLTPEAWLGAFDVHVHAVFSPCRAAIAHAREAEEPLCSFRPCPACAASSRTSRRSPRARCRSSRGHWPEFAPDNIQELGVARVIRTAFQAHERGAAEVELEQRTVAREAR